MRILAIDGGGIRGILPARVLVELERLAGRPIAEQFDLIVGTSTGGILALALTVPDGRGRPRFSAGDLLELYRSRGAEIFPGAVSRRRSRILAPARHSDEVVQPVFEEFLGQTPFGDACTDVLVPTFDLNSAKPLLFESREFGGMRDPGMSLVARATSANPTHMAPVRVEMGGVSRALVSGGVVANNPALLGYAVACSEADPAEITVVSLGTGSRERSGPASNGAAPRDRPWPRRAASSFTALVDGSAHAHHKILDLICGSRNGGGGYWRIQTSLGSCSPSLTASDQVNVSRLSDLADDMVDTHRAELGAATAALAG